MSWSYGNGQKEDYFPHCVHWDGVQFKHLKRTYIPSIIIKRIIWETVHFNQLKINGNYETQSADKYNLRILAAFFDQGVIYFATWSENLVKLNLILQPVAYPKLLF